MADLDAALPRPSLSPTGDALTGGAERSRALVLAHFDFVWRLLRRLGLPEPAVDDAAQQVFIVASRRLAEIPLGSERTFLYGTALRTAATWRRDSRRRARWEEAATTEAISGAPNPHEELERRQALALLDAILRRLEYPLREVFVLCEIEELTMQEVAVLVGIPMGTVASRLRRARREFALQVRRLRAKGAIDE
jgi:RNA polymerase sigma-70 factor, ECF subfamily